jgi:biotin-(acetyl-CoA carboxylase) ligase
VVGEAKVAGILLEADSSTVGDFPWVSVGIGVNIHQAPAVEGRPSAALQDLVPEATAAALQARLLARIWAELHHLARAWHGSGGGCVEQPWPGTGHANLG